MRSGGNEAVTAYVLWSPLFWLPKSNRNPELYAVLFLPPETLEDSQTPGSLSAGLASLVYKLSTQSAHGLSPVRQK